MSVAVIEMWWGNGENRAFRCSAAASCRGACRRSTRNFQTSGKPDTCRTNGFTFTSPQPLDWGEFSPGEDGSGGTETERQKSQWPNLRSDDNDKGERLWNGRSCSDYCSENPPKSARQLRKSL